MNRKPNFSHTVFSILMGLTLIVSAVNPTAAYARPADVTGPTETPAPTPTVPPVETPLPLETPTPIPSETPVPVEPPAPVISLSFNAEP